jgi:GntR family transcriptional regulator
VVVVIDAGSGVPVYRQIVDQVRFQVAGGVLPPGTELPSTRVLAQELGINPMTVSKAFGLLEEAGLLERRPGLPLVVRDATPRTLEAEREAQLRAALEPAARAVQQLGVDPERAVRVLRELLGGGSQVSHAFPEGGHQFPEGGHEFPDGGNEMEGGGE